ncbi:DUF2442 domain-containing protein [Aequorivita capsosiphonis]|uniref:DUF2442 domain-containing protein n=1 Tax=Aequorivita capsosiphonis TaxID=487317 RepID=UPI00040EE0C0|nr:DUF2442 domain-containing protein [Aequorivita capsosiphonis]
MSVSVVNAKLLKDFKLHIQFDNGESGVVDLESVILKDPRKIFEPLKNRDYFKNFSLDSWTIVWPNDFGFAPEFLYDLALSQNKKLEKATI